MLITKTYKALLIHPATWYLGRVFRVQHNSHSEFEHRTSLLCFTFVTVRRTS